jgi:hypothetical protein
MKMKMELPRQLLRFLYRVLHSGRTGLSEGAGKLLKKALSKSGSGDQPRLQDHYYFIEELRELYPVTRLLSMSRVPRANYYKWRAAKSQ